MYEALRLDQRAEICRDFADDVSEIKNRAAIEYLAARVYRLHIQGQHLNKTGWVQEIVDQGHARKTTANRLVDDFVAFGYLWSDLDRLRPTDRFLRDYLEFSERLDALLIMSGVVLQPRKPEACLLFDQDGATGSFEGGKVLGVEKKHWVMDMIHDTDIARRHGWDAIQEEIQGTYDNPPALPIRATVLLNGKQGAIVPTLVSVTVDEPLKTKRMEIFPLLSEPR